MLSELKVYLMPQMRNIRQPRLSFAILSDFCKLHAQIQILVEMLGPAVNRQPGFRRGLVEQSTAEKNNLIG